MLRRFSPLGVFLGNRCSSPETLFPEKVSEKNHLNMRDLASLERFPLKKVVLQQRRPPNPPPPGSRRRNRCSPPKRCYPRSLPEKNRLDMGDLKTHRPRGSCGRTVVHVGGPPDEALPF